MRVRSLREFAALAGVACAFVMYGLVTAGNVNATDNPRIRALAPREVSKDRPGTPARPVPGAPPAAPVVFNSFTSIQANVDGAGANIPGDAANEPSIAVDPNHPNRMAIVWRQFDTVTSDFRQAGWAYSRDGGRTWTFPGVLDPGVPRSDPVLDYDAAGNFYFMSLTWDDIAFSCDLFKSLDQGITWGPPIDAWGGDKEWIAIDRTGGIGNGHIYCSWDHATPYGLNRFTRSTDGGATFEAPLPLPGSLEQGTLAVAPDGTLYVSGTASEWIGGAWTWQYVVVSSTTAKDPTLTPTFSPETVVDLGGDIVWNLGPNPGGLVGQSYVDVNPVTGSVFVLCSVDPPGPDPLDVNIARSDDNGATWGPPIRVNSDPPAPDSWQWFGTMSIAPNGRIDVIWNDTRNGALYISELYYTYSTDGGLTWAAEVPISPAWNSWTGWPNQDKIGDYYDMVSDNVGAHVAWAATFNGEQDVYYMRIGDYDCNSNGIPDTDDLASGTSQDANSNGIPDECEEPSEPPVALCKNVEVPADENCLADASIDDGSYDRDSLDTITLTQDPPGPYALGETLVMLIVVDNHGLADSCTATVTVIDITPPEITVELNRDVLWPPNHKMVDILADVTVTDNCCASPTFKLVSITSNEPDNGKGDGNTIGDIQGADPGTPDVAFQLRSERSGGGDGRIYTILYEAQDCEGNSANATVTVRVPHDQSGKALASTGYTADGTGLDPSMMGFAIVILSTPTQIGLDAKGHSVVIAAAFDAMTLDPTRIYVGNTAGAIKPVRSLRVDNNNDGLGDLALFYTSADAGAIVFNSAVLTEDQKLEEDAGHGPVGLHYTDNGGVDYLVRNIFELGPSTPLGLPAEKRDPFSQDVISREDGDTEVPAARVNALGSAYPNPFNPTTTIPFELAGAEHVTLRIYTTGGALVRTLFDETLPGGPHRVVWDGRDQRGEPTATGVYFVHLQAGIYRATRKVVMIR